MRTPRSRSGRPDIGSEGVKSGPGWVPEGPLENIGPSRGISRTDLTEGCKGSKRTDTLETIKGLERHGSRVQDGCLGSVGSWGSVSERN